MFKSRAGQVVIARDHLGGQATLYVTAHEDDIKNGQPGFDAHLLDDPDTLVWRYDHQIIRVL